MTTKKKKADTEAEAEAESVAADKPPTLDRLVDLRLDITDNQSAVARLLDILIDANGGDADTIHETRESDAEAAADADASDDFTGAANVND